MLSNHSAMFFHVYHSNDLHAHLFESRRAFSLIKNWFPTSLHKKKNLVAGLASWILGTLEDALVKLPLFCPWMEFLLLGGRVDSKRREVLSFVHSQFPPLGFHEQPTLLPCVLKMSSPPLLNKYQRSQWGGEGGKNSGREEKRNDGTFLEERGAYQ